VTLAPVRPAEAYTGPANSETTPDGRWYLHPLTQERFISVTTALKVVAKEALVPWAAGLAAEAAMDELPMVVAASRKRPCGNTYKRCQHDWRERCGNCPCEDCRACVTRHLRDRHIAESSRRADEGTRVHKVIEWWALHDGAIRPHDKDIASYVTQFLAFVDDYGLTPASWELAETTVINRENGYAGTLDKIVRFNADASPAAAELCDRIGAGPMPTLLGDTKTREKTREEAPAKFYPEHALQVAALRNGEAVMLPDGTEIPLPAVDGGFVLQLRPDGYEARPVDAGPRTFGAFLSFLSGSKWQHEYATASVSVRSFPTSEEFRAERRRQRERQKRADAKAARATIPDCIACGGIGTYLEEWLEAPVEERPDGTGGPCPKCGGTGQTAVKTPARPKKTTVPTPSQPVRSATQSATLASIAGHREPHPDSPFNDELAF
jgi:hypothetical protein